jgi:hypothetical protein
METVEKKKLDYQFNFDEDWLTYLEENGYVVIKEVANKEEVEKSINLFWEHFEKHHPGVSRDKPETWVDWRVDMRGIVCDGNLIQSEAAWFIRGLPLIKKIFSKIWNDDSLIVSMDSTIMWKPW